MDLSFFSMEICTRYEPSAPLHGTLHRLVTSHPVNATLQQKWLFYREITSTLLAALPVVERGCWEYFDEDARARRDYEHWVSAMLTEDTARKQPSGDDPYRGGARYMIFTMAMLLVNGSYVDLAVRAACDIPEPVLWHRATFRKILEGLRALNFASVQSDVVYLIPRDAGYGLTHDDLAQSKFDYLRPLV